MIKSLYCLIGQPFIDQDHIVVVARGDTIKIFEENPIVRTAGHYDDCLKSSKIPELP